VRDRKNASSGLSKDEEGYAEVEPVVPVLETPSGKVAEKLEQHRLEVEARKAMRAGRSKARI
jgi:hypothetical protein